MAEKKILAELESREIKHIDAKKCGEKINALIDLYRAPKTVKSPKKGENRALSE